MLKIILFIIIFFLSMMGYLHIYNQVTTCDATHLMYAPYIGQDQLLSLCLMKRPILINLPDNLTQLLNHAPTFAPDQNVQIRCSTDASTGALPLALEYSKLEKLNKSKTNDLYYSDTDANKITGSPVIERLSSLKFMFAPALTTQSAIHVMSGPLGGCTITRQELCERTFIMTHGRATVRLVSPKYSEWLHAIHDHYQFETRTQTQIFSDDNPSWKYIDADIHPGVALFVPNHWWFSVRFNNPGTVVYRMAFHTYASQLIMCPRYGATFLQRLNVTYKVASDSKESVTNKYDDSCVIKPTENKENACVQSAAVESAE